MPEQKPNQKKHFYKNIKFWVAVFVIIGLIGAIQDKDMGKQASETSKTTGGETVKVENTEKAKLTLDDGWAIDTSNQFAAFVNGYVTNNTDKAITNYVQITFTAYDESNATVGSCMANANNIDAKGKWKFQAFCTGKGVKTVKFKEITGF